MAAVTYTKQDWKAEADIQRLPDGTYQGVVLLTRMGSPSPVMRFPGNSTTR